MQKKKHTIGEYDTIPIVIDGIVHRYVKIKKQYRGYLGEHNAPQFPANTWVMQANKPIHFYYALN